MLVFQIITISSLSLSTKIKYLPIQRYLITQSYKERGDRLLPVLAVSFSSHVVKVYTMGL